MKEIEQEKKNWYDSPKDISNIAILFIAIIIILSQAFAVNNGLSADYIFRNILNHNILYLMSLFYFIPIKTRLGKKYFNYFSIFLIIVYLIYTVTSVFSMIQSFGLISLLNFIINIIFLIYISHNLLKNTRIWKELKMTSSPFYEITNENYFNAIIIISIILLAINLIESATFDDVVLSLLGTLYSCILARYIYLFGEEDIKESNFFKELEQTSKELPRLKTMERAVSNKELNNYQILSIITFGICFVVGIIFGNIFPSCSTTGLFTSTCTSKEFNFSLTITIWFISFLVCVFFYGLGQIISLLNSINKNLEKKK